MRLDSAARGASPGDAVMRLARSGPGGALWAGRRAASGAPPADSRQVPREAVSPRRPGTDGG